MDNPLLLININILTFGYHPLIIHSNLTSPSLIHINSENYSPPQNYIKYVEKTLNQQETTFPVCFYSSTATLFFSHVANAKVKTMQDVTHVVTHGRKKKQLLSIDNKTAHLYNIKKKLTSH